MDAFLESSLAQRWDDSLLALATLRLLATLEGTVQGCELAMLPRFAPLVLKAAACNPHVVGPALPEVLPLLVRMPCVHFVVPASKRPRIV